MERYSAAAAINPHEEAMNVPPQTYPFHSSLHSVRKAPVKPWKKPTVPQPPNPTWVYKVEPINFRELVQQLTRAPSQLPPLPARLQEAAPPPNPPGPISAVITTQRWRRGLQLLYLPCTVS
ncbi:hypothetical protein NL676_022792 [Syzygium grande]|nr:hypothetical protein NL676_022792 [Syzygium grande]